MSRALASRYGVTDDELLSPIWPSGPIHGIRSHRDLDRANPWTRIREVMAAFPLDAAISGWAGCYLHGADWLDGRGPGGSPFLPITLALQPHVQTRRRTGLRVLRSAFDQDEVEMIDGLPVLSPVRSTYDGIRTSSLVEGVVLLDAMLHFRLVSAEELSEYVERHPRGRGNPLVRRALQLADARVLSPQETRARMLWMLDAKLPRPEVNVPVYTEDGKFLGRPDLLDPAAGVAVEYDGETHADLEQRTYDYSRREEFGRAGLIVVTLTSLCLTVDRANTIVRLRTARRRGMARDRRLDRWRI